MVEIRRRPVLISRAALYRRDRRLSEDASARDRSLKGVDRGGDSDGWWSFTHGRGGSLRVPYLVHKLRHLLVSEEQVHIRQISQALSIRVVAGARIGTLERDATPQPHLKPETGTVARLKRLRQRRLSGLIQVEHVAREVPDTQLKDVGLHKLIKKEG
jgi:hypothetical protein